MKKNLCRFFSVTHSGHLFMLKTSLSSIGNRKLAAAAALLMGFIFLPTAEARQATLTPQRTKDKLTEIMRLHATHKTLSPELVQRALLNFLEELDPHKSYFEKKDIEQWLNPGDEIIKQILLDYEQNNFSIFQKIIEKMQEAIMKRREIEEKIDLSSLTEKINLTLLKDLFWAENEEQLKQRMVLIKALQRQSINKLPQELHEKSLQRLAKQQSKYEEEFLNNDPIHQRNLLLTLVLKAIARSLDSQTNYFTPDEAEFFIMQVQQRLSGIGAQLRDDITGLSIIKVIEGGPADIQGQLKAKDRIIAVDGEPIVGMDINAAVALIRGPDKSTTRLTVIREVKNGSETAEETLEISLIRGEVIFKDTRYKVDFEPFGDGVIAYLRLYTFYQDEVSSSASDLTYALKQLQQEKNVKGVILDLRHNTGGLLTQAIEVTGLFITKGIVASIKDEKGTLQHLRDTDGTTIWDGPLIILINKASASASEIVAQTLQDYGRALVVGDSHTYGKGSYQSFSANATSQRINPEGEFKVTRGRYYTVSGKSPQLLGVAADIVVPGPLAEVEIGEKFSKYPLEGDQIAPHFHDDLSDLPFLERYQARLLYQYNLQPHLDIYAPYLKRLQENSAYRIEHDKNYQNFLAFIKKVNDEEDVEEVEEKFGQQDIQLEETYNIMKDLISLSKKE